MQAPENKSNGNCSQLWASATAKWWGTEQKLGLPCLENSLFPSCSTGTHLNSCFSFCLDAVWDRWPHLPPGSTTLSWQRLHKGGAVPGRVALCPCTPAVNHYCGIPNWHCHDSQGLRLQKLILSHEKKKNYIKSVKKQPYLHNLSFTGFKMGKNR